MKKLGIWLIAIIFVATAFVSSCRHKAKQDVSPEAVAERVWQFSQAHPDGFTIDIRTFEEPQMGIAVAYAATQGCHSRESLTKVVTHALDHDGYVGGWYDSESGLYYFDSSKLFPEDQMDEALDFARKNGQAAIYVISTGEVIRIDEQLPLAA